MGFTFVYFPLWWVHLCLIFLSLNESILSSLSLLFLECQSRHMNQSIKGTFTTITSWIIGFLSLRIASLFLYIYIYSLQSFCVAKHLDIYMPPNLLYPGCTFVHRHLRWMRINSNGIWYSNKLLLRMETFYSITVYSNHMLQGLVPILK